MPSIRERLRAWYRRPSGMGEVLTLLLPLVVSTASWTLLQFFDRLFLLGYSTDALAASLPAGALSFAILCFPLGIAAYVNAFVAQYFGAGRHERIGLAVWQAVFIAVASAPLMLLTNPIAPDIMAWAGHTEKLARLEVEYFCIMNWGAGGLLISSALSSFFTGRGQTRVVMVIDCSIALFDIVLNYCWIFGKFGFPEWGLAGAAWSTVLSLWLKTLIYFILFLRPQMREVFGTARGCRIDVPLFMRLLRFGAPNGVQFLVEVAGFTIFVMLVAQLGDIAAAATSLAFNVNTLAFMPVYGAGIATTTLVGQRLGEDEEHLAARATWMAFVLAAGYMLAFSIIYVLLPDIVLYLHHDVSEDPRYPEIYRTTVVLLRFVAFYCMFDAMYTVFAGTLKGAGDTKFVLYTTLITSGVTTLVTWLGLKYWGFGLWECWITITAWVTALGIIYLIRFLQGSWRSMRIIEPALAE